MNFKIIFSIIAVLLLTSCVSNSEEGADITISSIDEEQPDEVPEETTTVNTTEDTSDSTDGDTTVEPEGQEQPTGNYEIIEIEDLKFKPDEITIGKGTAIKWIHNDLYADSKTIKHIIRVYEPGEVFNLISQPLFFGDSFEYTFTEPGEYYYISIVYASRGVRGSITVE